MWRNPGCAYPIREKLMVRKTRIFLYVPLTELNAKWRMVTSEVCVVSFIVDTGRLRRCDVSILSSSGRSAHPLESPGLGVTSSSPTGRGVTLHCLGENVSPYQTIRGGARQDPDARFQRFPVSLNQNITCLCNRRRARSKATGVSRPARLLKLSKLAYSYRFAMTISTPITLFSVKCLMRESRATMQDQYVR